MILTPSDCAFASLLPDYLMLGESPGSKLARAQSLGVKIVDESALRKMG